MVRRVASLVVGLLAALVQPVLAGDRAQIAVIGFSESGSYFAFEEFGIQDGSGFAYSNIYVLDLVTDSWVLGTPIRLQAEDESTPLPAIRAAAQVRAATDIDALGIAVPGHFVVMVGDGAPGTAGRSLGFGPPPLGTDPVVGSHRLELTAFPTRSATPCVEWFDAPPQGYQLRLVTPDGDRLVHRDTDLPRSRGCPVDYRLHGVVVPFGAVGLAHAVGIISVYSFGFEGPDRRFLAVPLGL